jgi:hypothetical protein
VTQFQSEIVQLSFREGVATLLVIDASQVFIRSFSISISSKAVGDLEVVYDVTVAGDDAAGVSAQLAHAEELSASISAALEANEAPITEFEVTEASSDDADVTASGQSNLLCENYYSDDDCHTLISSSCHRTAGLSCAASINPYWDTVCEDGFDGYNSCCSSTSENGDSFKATCGASAVQESPDEYILCLHLYTDTACRTEISGDDACLPPSEISCDDLLEEYYVEYQSMSADFEELNVCYLTDIDYVASIKATCTKNGVAVGVGSAGSLSTMFALIVPAILALLFLRV